MSAAPANVARRRRGAARRAPDRGARRHPDLRLRPARLRRHAGARDLVRIRRLPAQPGAGAGRGHGEPDERQPRPCRRVRHGRPDRRRPARRLRRPRRRRARPVRMGQPDPRQRRAARRRRHRCDAVGARLHHAPGDEHRPLRGLDRLAGHPADRRRDQPLRLGRRALPGRDVAPRGVVDRVHRAPARRRLGAGPARAADRRPPCERSPRRSRPGAASAASRSSS